jgi:hypothetical protein
VVTPQLAKPDVAADGAMASGPASDVADMTTVVDVVEAPAED